MGKLTVGDFAAFFQEMHGHQPFPWQKRLAEQVCAGAWPGVLDLPTASGKTACLDVAVFAMAVRGSGPRRVFFVVDRRVVVDAAFDRMRKIRRKLRGTTHGVLKAAADRLREISGGPEAEPLEVHQMRGGIYRDDQWVRSPLQPALISSTVDQTGSRLLFRGYGLSDSALPIHASLIANDALILLDEAHCSRPFAETLQAVCRYRADGWSECLDTPFAFVQMTATPAGQADEPFGLDAADYRDPMLRKRLYAPKPVRLVTSKSRPNDLRKLAENLIDEAERLAAKPGLCRIAVMVNRVRTARLAFDVLKQRGRRAHLLIGRMRPFDRLKLPPDLAGMLSGQARTDRAEAVFVVATQCLEVGADLDFDSLVTECAGIDALLQRFGRLDRVGDLQKSEGVVMISGGMADGKHDDPVYGASLAKTWDWLKRSGDSVDFGICSKAGGSTVRERLVIAGEDTAGLRRAPAPVPTLLPAHMDLLVQTSPRPALAPDVSLYLHGEESGPAEVRVLWRADLDLTRLDEWPAIVALCPPVSSEAMPVPYRAFVAWLTHAKEDAAGLPDLEGFDWNDNAYEGSRLRCPVLRWRGEESSVVRALDEIRRIVPGDTLVLSAFSGGWDELGHVPQPPAASAAIDIAESARHALRRGQVLRFHPQLIADLWPDTPSRQHVIELAGQPTLERRELCQRLQDYRESLGTEAPAWLLKALEDPQTLELESYPGPSGPSPLGWVLRSKWVEADAGADESSAAGPVFLDRHLKNVANTVRPNAEALLADERLRHSLAMAAELHDCGKADLRFQSLLRGGDPMAAHFAPKPLAKGSRSGPAERARCGLPAGFRHELISLLLAQTHAEAGGDELALHLIATHHGWCRPFAPVVDDRGGDLAYGGLHISADARIAHAPHRLDSGIADRFWKLTRQYGWWGLAYLEALLRLGDWNASRDEQQKVETKEAKA